MSIGVISCGSFLGTFLGKILCTALSLKCLREIFKKNFFDRILGGSSEKLLGKFLGEICWGNLLVNFIRKILGRIYWGNLLVNFVGEIYWGNFL